MLLPARRGVWGSALRLRAWIDERMLALGMKRSPLASSLRENFHALQIEARAAATWREPNAAPAGALDDAEVCHAAPVAVVHVFGLAHDAEERHLGQDCRVRRPGMG